MTKVLHTLSWHFLPDQTSHALSTTSRVTCWLQDENSVRCWESPPLMSKGMIATQPFPNRNFSGQLPHAKTSAMSTENASWDSSVSPVLGEFGPVWKQVGAAIELRGQQRECSMGEADTTEVQWSTRGQTWDRGQAGGAGLQRPGSHISRLESIPKAAGSHSGTSLSC